MKKVIIIIVAVVLVVAIIAAVLFVKSNSGEPGYHDGTIGKIVFNKLGSEIGYGIEANQGEFPMDVEITEGKLNIKITRYNETIFEQTDINSSQRIVATLPEAGGYLISLSGKKASGTINYPVSSEESTPVVNGTQKKSNGGNDETVRTEVTKYLKDGSNGEIVDVIFDNVKVYSKSEIESDETLSNLDTGDKDIIFEVTYRLKISEDCEDIQVYTAATGEVDGQWVINKYNCGVARYNEEDNSYEITDFGTGF